MPETNQIKNDVYNLLEDRSLWINTNNTIHDLDRFVENMQTKYNYLYTNSKTLFERCIKGDLNLEQFEYMMQMLENVNKGADYNKTSIQVGQKLADIYINPIINKNK